MQDHIHESVCFQLFVYLFAPICHQIKESDLQTFRLENGIKIWQSMWEHRHPIAPCFTTQVKPKPRDVWAKMLKRPRTQFGDVFLGSKYYNISRYNISSISYALWQKKILLQPCCLKRYATYFPHLSSFIPFAVSVYF